MDARGARARRRRGEISRDDHLIRHHGSENGRIRYHHGPVRDLVSIYRNIYNICINLLGEDVEEGWESGLTRRGAVTCATRAVWRPWPRKAEIVMMKSVKTILDRASRKAHYGVMSSQFSPTARSPRGSAEGGPLTIPNSYDYDYVRLFRYDTSYLR